MNRAETIAVSFDPSRLPALDRWRLYLRRMSPRSHRPIASALFRCGFVVLAMGWIGYVIGWAAGAELPTGAMIAIFGASGLLIALRLYRFQRLSIRLLASVAPIEVEVARAGVAIRSRNRVTRVDWAGVSGLLLTEHEVVLLFRAGDLASVPRRAFADPSDVGRFHDLAMSGLAASSRGTGLADLNSRPLESIDGA